MVKNLPVNAGDTSLILGREESLQKEMAPAPIFLPGKSHGQRSLTGYRLWGHKESDTI